MSTHEELSGPALLAHHAGRLHTSVGAAFPGSHAVFRGHDLHRELCGLEWVQLYAFGITGRHITPAQAELVQAMWTHTSYPDARLWNNRVAALAGNARSSASLGMVAGMAVSEATTYGGQATMLCMTFLQNALRQVQAGAALADVVWAETGRSKIYGYGRPINSNDERLPFIMALAERLGLHEQLAGLESRYGARAGLERDIADYVLTGEPRAVLAELKTAVRALGQQLRLCGLPPPLDEEALRAFYAGFSSLPCAVALRWTHVLDAGWNDGAARHHGLAMPDGSRWTCSPPRPNPKPQAPAPSKW
eukprot:gene37119-45795_t